MYVPVRRNKQVKEWVTAVRFREKSEIEPQDWRWAPWGRGALRKWHLIKTPEPSEGVAVWRVGRSFQVKSMQVWRSMESMHWNSFFLIKIFFLIGGWLLYIVFTIASAGQQCESAICLHLAPPSWASFHPPPHATPLVHHRTELSSLQQLPTSCWFYTR